MLPRGEAPETIGERAHRWTYGVFLVALLHDLDRSLGRIEVSMRIGAGPLRPWSPLGTAAPESGATCYRVEVHGDDSPRVVRHPMLPFVLLGRWVPTEILGWLAGDRALLDELHTCLSGEDPVDAGAIAALVQRAEAAVQQLFGDRENSGASAPSGGADQRTAARDSNRGREYAADSAPDDEFAVPPDPTASRFAPEAAVVVPGGRGESACPRHLLRRTPM